MRTVVVLAGGLGSRVAHLTGDDRPKALLPIAGRAFIDVKLAQLRTAGAQQALVLTGHGGAALEEHLRSLSLPGLEVSWHTDGRELRGTGGAIVGIRDLLPETFWVTYGDTLVEAPMESVEGELGDEMLGVMTVLHNRDRWAPSNATVEAGMVVHYEKGAAPAILEWIDYGLLLLRRSVFDAFSALTSFDLTEPIQDAVVRGRLGAFTVSERFHDIGTEASWHDTDDWARETHLLERLALV